eukprot:SAG31_NODE_2035_length_6610_cov_9.308555_2_plen_133_part_00
MRQQQAARVAANARANAAKAKAAKTANAAKSGEAHSTQIACRSPATTGLVHRLTLWGRRSAAPWRGQHCVDTKAVRQNHRGAARPGQQQRDLLHRGPKARLREYKQRRRCVVVQHRGADPLHPRHSNTAGST